MRPRTDDDDVEDAGVLLLDRLIRAEGAVQILGIEPAADRHHRGSDLLQVRQQVSVMPKFIVGRMRHHFIPEGDLVLVVTGVDVLEGADVEEEAIAVRGAIVRPLLSILRWRWSPWIA